MSRRSSSHPGGIVLITGGAGFVATNLADRLLRSGLRVRLLDNLSRAGVEQNVRWLEAQHGSQVEVQLGDIRDGAALSTALRGVDRVFHLAAQVAVTTSLVDPFMDFEVNAVCPRLRPHLRVEGDGIPNELHLRPAPVRDRRPGLGGALRHPGAAGASPHALR